MASLTRRTYTPKDADGKPLLDASGKPVIRQVANWSITFRDAAGRQRRVKGYRDKGATKQLAAKLELAHARGETGLLNPFRESLVQPIGEHVTDYIADLKATGRSAMYRYNIQKRLDVLIAGAGWKCLRDIEAASFIQWRATFKPRKSTARRDGKKTASAEALNQYLETARAFTNWCAKMKRMPGVPISASKVVATVLATVDKVDGPEVRQRRALSDAQAATLLSVASSADALVYRVGMSIGLRRGELAALQWGDLRLSAIKPYGQLRAEDTKAKRADRVSVPATLAADLRAVKPSKAKDSDRVFTKVPTIRQWKRDLAAAGIPYMDEMGRQADFHGGTRKSLCTRMHRAGVPLAAAMRVMRHTDARLTMKDYVDDEQLGADDVVPAMEELKASSPPRAADSAAS